MKSCKTLTATGTENGARPGARDTNSVSGTTIGGRSGAFGPQPSRSVGIKIPAIKLPHFIITPSHGRGSVYTLAAGQPYYALRSDQLLANFGNILPL